MRFALCMAIAVAGSACSDPGVTVDAGFDGSRARIDAQLGTIGPMDGMYSLSWTCEEGCLGGAPFEYFDRLTIDRQADPVELTYRQSECGPGCDVVDTAVLDEPCLDAAGIDVGGGNTTDPYSFCPDAGGPSAQVTYRGPPGPDKEAIWIGQARPIGL